MKNSKSRYKQKPKTSRMLRHERRLKRKGFSRIAGVDEAGRGPLAGPVVAAGVILKTFTFKEIIDDSKRLSPKRRERAFREIKKKAHIGIGIVDERTIDRVNIYRATCMAMKQALAALRRAPDFVLIDGNVKVASPLPKQCVKYGDAHSLSIAAASIIAKVTRDRLMHSYDAMYPQYGFSRHKGYGTKQHLAALKVHGPSPIHRITFRGTRQ